MRLIKREAKGVMKPGQELVAAGYTGMEGARRIALVREKELLGWFSQDYVRQIQEKETFIIGDNLTPWREYGAAEWEEAGEGGIFTALWNLSGAYMLGFEVDLCEIPVRQETIEVCERYELNPYRLYSGNCAVAAADNGGRLARRLAGEGIPAAVIGVVREDIRREIRYGRVKGFLERPRQDELYKVLKQEELL